LGGSPGEGKGPPAPAEGETFKVVVEGEADKEETQSTETTETPEGENKVEEVAGETTEPVPGSQELQATEPISQEQKLVESEAEKPIQSASEVPQEVKESEFEKAALPGPEKVAIRTNRPETQAPIEDKNIPLLSDTEKIEKDITGKEASLPEEKELRALEAKEDGLIPVPKKEPRELAYVPPWELRGKTSEASTPKGHTSIATSGKSKPKVMMSFNGKTLSGGEIMPLMDAAEANAPGEGEPSFNVKKDEYAPYYKHIRDRISWYWYLGYGTRQEIKLETEDNKPIIVEFKVYPEGLAKDVKIVQEAGNHLLASRIKDSIGATRLDRFSRF
ncbi:MAG TPA: hypothetical protein ACFYEM_05345, partial [Candidatus Hypogeohydataceae bacterium YC40]